MPVDLLSNWVASCLLLSLRVGPMFVYAPPFTLTRVPRVFSLLFSLGLAIVLVSAHPEVALLHEASPAILLVGAVRELMLGLIPVLVLNLLFGALYLVGRTIDIQSGYGLATLIDPTSNSQTPLVGTLFAYLAGAIFFALDGHSALLGYFVASLDAIPLAQAHGMPSLTILCSYIFSTSVIAFGVGGGAILVLFLADLGIGILSRTVPQMNALLLGIQVKSLLMLAILPLLFSATAAIIPNMLISALRVLPRLT